MAGVNQQEIADRLGLSKATVSRCFTNHAGISAVTRAKVFQLAAELGYTHLESRSKKAQKKAKRKPTNFSVLICTDTDEYFRKDYESPGEQILAGVSEYAQLNNAQVDVHFIPPDVTGIDDPAFKKIKGLKDRQSRGIFLIYPFPSPIIDELSVRFPLISLIDQVQQHSIDCVDVDHFDGISTVVDHLVEQGHERIGFYTRAYPVDASWSFRRYSAFLEKMSRLKLKVTQKDTIGIYPRAFPDVAKGIEEAAERTRLGVTAWVCAADHQAYDLINDFKKRGLKIPRDVSVTGFDGIQQPGATPSLTTIKIPFRSIGMTGAERLATRIRKRFGEKQHIYIAGDLREGKSVGPPKA